MLENLIRGHPGDIIQWINLFLEVHFRNCYGRKYLWKDWGNVLIEPTINFYPWCFLIDCYRNILKECVTEIAEITCVVLLILVSFFSTSEVAFHSCLVEYFSEKIDKIPSRETFTAEFLFGKTLRKSKTTLWNCVNLSGIIFLNLNPNLGGWGEVVLPPLLVFT